MKTSSEYQLETPMHKVMQASSFQMNISTSYLTDINAYIMKKLTNISPFLLLLVPVFIMMAVMISSNLNNTAQNEMAMKTTQNNEISKVSTQLVK